MNKKEGYAFTNFLKHKNPHTGKTYAKDPANAFVEFQNEDSIFLGSEVLPVHAGSRAATGCTMHASRL